MTWTNEAGKVSQWDSGKKHYTVYLHNNLLTMMKRLLFSMVMGGLLFVGGNLSAQNIQLHYDMGHVKDGELARNREYFTVTTEMFKPDRLGSTFFFIDMNFNQKDGSAAFAYWEIKRTFKVSKSLKGLNVSVEYNDGTADGSVGFKYVNRSVLAGAGYDFNLGSWFISTSLQAKKFTELKGLDAQFTLVWNKKFLNNKLAFTGFMDVWSEKDMTVLLAEPQLWFPVSKNFELGAEVEISRNFFTFDKDFEVMPTLAIKYNL